MPWPRVILHVDMDAFYASVEQRDDAAMRGKPVLVGGDGGRGVVMAASYEARTFGCHSAQPMSIAKRLCPHAVIVRGSMAKYSRVSREMFAILDGFSPLVQPISIDEAFIDLTGSERLLGEPSTVAMAIKRRIRGELQLTASVGVAANKFLAKLASDLEKPDGLTVIAPDEVDRVLPPLPVGKLWGAGPRTVERLARFGIHTIGDLRRASEQLLNSSFGEFGAHFRRLAFGLDDREVSADHDAKSIGHENTFGADVGSPDGVRAELLELTEHVAWRLRKHGRRAGTVTVKIRFGDFQTITRSQTLKTNTDLTVDLWDAALALFNQWAAKSFQPVRLVGVSVSHLTAPPAQLQLFDHPIDQRQRKLDIAVDAINQKFGRDTVRRGSRREA